MRKSFWLLWLLLPLTVQLASCNDDDDVDIVYTSWQLQNAQWFLTVADSARTAIAAARAQWGDDWEQHCDWRMYKSLQKSEMLRGAVTDSICIHFLQRGEGTVSPRYTDSVRVNFRGFLMPTHTTTADGRDSLVLTTFTQTYYGTFNPATAAPQLMVVSSTVAGFSTALQYMHVGDNAWVYIPQQLGYKDAVNGAIPAYSTLAFHMNLVGIYPPGEAVPGWK